MRTHNHSLYKKISDSLVVSTFRHRHSGRRVLRQCFTLYMCVTETLAVWFGLKRDAQLCKDKDWANQAQVQQAGWDIDYDW